jgi:hypothetical protein
MLDSYVLAIIRASHNAGCNCLLLLHVFVFLSTTHHCA